ncbi:hypothetical protein N7453_004534 [Penicillium expansum]|nr:hypothetical protein N7453_004534 [Penicillium expansum]
MGLSAVGGVVLPPEEGWGEVAQARETKGGEGKEQGYDAAYRGAQPFPGINARRDSGLACQLCDYLFRPVATSSTSNEPHLALLGALHAHPPTQLNVRVGSNARSYTGADGKLYCQTLPRFSAQWCDVHDILEAWRE